MSLFEGEGWDESYAHQKIFKYTPFGNSSLLGLTSNPFGGACCIIRRTVFNQLGGFTTDLSKYVGDEDYEFFRDSVFVDSA